MGEIQRHTHRLDGEQFDAILAALRAALPAEPAPQAETPYDLGLVPWAFHDPKQSCDVVAYLDPQNQIRHVPATRATEVPKAWQRVWLESRS